MSVCTPAKRVAGNDTVRPTRVGYAPDPYGNVRAGADTLVITEDVGDHTNSDGKDCEKKIENDSATDRIVKGGGAAGVGVRKDAIITKHEGVAHKINTTSQS